MATMKEHLKSFHEKAAGFHTQAGKHHAALAKCFGSMSKAGGIESSSDISDAHKGLSEQHISLAEFHLECCSDLMSKAAIGMDRDDLIPDQVFGYLPEMPSNVRAVPRAGQREFGADKFEPGSVMEKIFGGDE